MSDITMEIASRLREMIPGFTEEMEESFVSWMTTELLTLRAQRERALRNREIIRDYRQGESPTFLARKYRITRQRVWQIVQG